VGDPRPDPSRGAVCRTTTIDAPPSVVWRCISTSALVERWLSDSGLRVTSDWRAGSSIRCDGTWDGNAYEDHGTIPRLEPERGLEYTCWSGLSRLPDRLELYAAITFALTPAPGQTALTVTHGRLRSPAMVGHARFSWCPALERLRAAIEAE